MTSTPVPITATVTPPPLTAPRCAAASIPSARPLTTMTPARAPSRPTCSPTAPPLGVEAALTFLLQAPGGDHPLPHRRRRLASGFRREQLELDAPDRHLEVDPVQERAGQPALIGVDRPGRAPAAAHPVAGPPAGAWIRRGNQREACRVRHRAA